MERYVGVPLTGFLIPSNTLDTARIMLGRFLLSDYLEVRVILDVLGNLSFGIFTDDLSPSNSHHLFLQASARECGFEFLGYVGFADRFDPTALTLADNIPRSVYVLTDDG